jgi:formate hydrogenlyase subunit 3/multisubunit Na+/H+ antiporter MnhD subunit
MPALAAALVVVPLAAAPLAVLLGRRGALAVLLAAGIGLTGCAAVLLAGLEAGGTVRHAIGGWGAPLGIVWRVDGLSALLIAASAVVGLGVAVYAAIALPRAAVRGAVPPFLLLLAGLNALFLSADVFNLYITIELVSLAAVVLAATAGGGAALTAAMRYLLVAQAGSLCYLLGVGFLYAAFGTLDIAMLGERVKPGAPAAAALGLMTVALFAKAALFPLHGWMPALQGAVTTPVAALMSAIVELAFLYILVRLWFEVFPAVTGPETAALLGGLGAAAVAWGSLVALRQPRLRLLVAYSTVAQYGYLLLLLPLGRTAAAADAWTGVVVLAIAHAFAKAGMFLAAGALLAEGRGDGMDRLYGAGRRLPMAMLALALCGLTLMGLPPSGGFTAKWLLAGAALTAGQWWWAVVLLAGSLLAAAYVFTVLSRALSEDDPPGPAADRPVGVARQAVPMAFALASLAMGAAAGPVAALLARGGTP